MNKLNMLLIEDDEENLRLLKESLPAEICNSEMQWAFYSDFDKAIKQLSTHRYDVIVSDVYKGREVGGLKTDYSQAKQIYDTIKGIRFCPIVLFSDGSAPEFFNEGPFTKFADKAKGAGGESDIYIKIKEVIDTGIPVLSMKLHEELEKEAGSYLWKFVEEKWDLLKKSPPRTVEQLIRRRAALIIARLDPDSTEISERELVEGLEYYISPPVTKNIRLGEIIKKRDTEDYSVVITPHCFLFVHPGEVEPRAEYVHIIKTIKADEIIRREGIPGGSEEKKLETLCRYTRSPSTIGKPSGRYWFIPEFLEMPDLFCDFLQIESIPYSEIQDHYERFAVLDTPFAEALQSCFTRFCSALGLPGLSKDYLRKFIEKIDG